jgi:CYTH domain-containing protein
MAKKLEIERKYLLKRLPAIKWDYVINIKQFYLPDKTRIRQSFVNGGFEFIKCKKVLLSKKPKVYEEDEKEITKDEFLDLFKKSKTGLAKTRFIKKVPGGLKWEVDMYEDIDLIVAELEIPKKKFKVKIPKFISDVLIMEVTEFSEFTNRSLSEKIKK